MDWLHCLCETSLRGCLQVGSVSFERQGIADHAKDLVANIAGNLGRSLEAIGVDILLGSGKFVDTHTVECVPLMCLALYRIGNTVVASYRECITDSSSA